MPPVPGRYAEVDLGQADFAGVFARDADIGGHCDLKPAAYAVAIDGGNHQFRRVLETQQGFIRMEAEVILERRVDARQHFDVCTRGEELIAYACEHDYIDVVIHAGFEDGFVELAVHLVGIGVGGRIVHFDDSNAAIGAVVDELFGGFGGTGCGWWP